MAPEVIACEQQLEYSYDMRCDIWYSILFFVIHNVVPVRFNALPFFIVFNCNLKVFGYYCYRIG